MIAVLMLGCLTGVAQANSVDAHGSAEQVYVTGLHGRAAASLLDPSGRTVSTRHADGQGGVLFRHVAPARGYRVRSGSRRSAALTVLSGRDAPPTTTGYHQRLPTSGYGYLTTRDGTELAIDVHLPGRGRGRIRRWSSTRATATPTRRGRERDQPDRQPARLRRRRRQHARHRLLGRRVRLLRAAAGPRRLRRRRDRRAPAVGARPPRGDDGHLLRRHQPALRRRHRPAAPGRDRAAVGDRQHGHDAVSGRDPQHRLRALLGQGARPRRAAGLGRPAARRGR